MPTAVHFCVVAIALYFRSAGQDDHTAGLGASDVADVEAAPGSDGVGSSQSLVKSLGGAGVKKSSTSSHRKSNHKLK